MNFKGILSKSSTKSSSSGKSLTRSEEVSRLQNEIETLKETITLLKVSVESRDAAIGTLASEKEKTYNELKCVQRTNRNLHQQLVDERDIHCKEKEFLINDIKRLTKRSEDKKEKLQKRDVYEDQCETLYDEMRAKDEVIYSIGTKYMKIKSAKISLQKKLENLETLNKKLREKIFFLLQDNKKTLDNLLVMLLKSPTLSPNSKNFLKLLQINASLHYENTQLKIFLSNTNSNKILHQLSSNKQERLEKKEFTDKHVKMKNSYMKVPELHSPPNLIRCPIRQRFKCIHRTFSLNSRGGKLYKSTSDPCIERSNEYWNVNNKN